MASAKNYQGDGGNTGKGGQQSPRNAPNVQPGTITKAVRLAPVEVSKSLQDGEKFIKWDDVSIFLVHFCFIIIIALLLFECNVLQTFSLQQILCFENCQYH